jgi:formylglycine-generating enzyme required for sulfatase activity
MRQRLPLLLFACLSLLATPLWAEQLVMPERAFRDALVNGHACPHCPLLRAVPRGRFLMGALPGEGNANELGPDGGPFVVDFAAPLAVGQSEVGLGEFAAFAAANPQVEIAADCAGFVDGLFRRGEGLSWRSPGFAQRDDHPVVCVSWAATQAYVDWLSRITGQRYRLLSEAEWEYVARGGSPVRYWWGDWLVPGMANCAESDCVDGHAHTAAADALPANHWGFFNTLGNVWEWVQDCYRHDAYTALAGRYPAPAPERDGCQRVLRGGGWQDRAWSLRLSNRQGWSPNTALNDVGFRVAREGLAIPGLQVRTDARAASRLTTSNYQQWKK